MLEALERDRVLQRGIDAVVRHAGLGTSHVGRERRPIVPARDHEHLLGVAVRAPDLEVDEARGIVDQVGAAAERGDEGVGLADVHAQPETSTRTHANATAADR